MKTNDLNDIITLFDGYNITFWDSSSFKTFTYTGFGADNVNKEISLALMPSNDNSCLEAFEKVLKTMAKHGLDMNIDWKKEFVTTLNKEILH